MTITVIDGKAYVNNVYLCFVEAGNGRTHLPVGRYEVIIQFSHRHGRVLPDALGIGWIGATPECDIVLGRVRHGNSVIPLDDCVDRLLSRLEEDEGLGRPIALDIR